MTKRPFDGVRIVDLTRVLAGPYCTMMLADLGADVIKIESPDHGDEMRSWEPIRDGASLYFDGLNRNKRSVALDLRDPAGARALRRLLATADIVVENFRPGGLARLGFGYEDVREIKADIIYCSISGYGNSGPRRDEPGYDPVVQAESGLMDATGLPSGPPTRCGVPIVDYLAGLHAVQGILVALLHRRATGEGQHVDVALFDCAMSTMVLHNALVHVYGDAPRRGNEHPAIAPYETLQARDGLVMVAVGNQRLWRLFCGALGIGQLADDPRFVSNAARLTHRPALRQALEAVLCGLDVAEVVRRLRSVDVPCGRVRTVAEALHDPQLDARGMLVEIDRRRGFSAIAHPVHFSALPMATVQPPPALGEHTRELLAELGLAHDAIQPVGESATDNGSVD